MIKSFSGRDIENIWNGLASKRFPIQIQQLARRKLRILNNSADLKDLMVPPYNRLEKLKSERKNKYSIRINNQWRICFFWIKGDCYEVEITDYH